MRERCIQCALANTPTNVRYVQIRKDLCGYATLQGPDTGRMAVPKPITRRALYVFLHECAHFVLHADYKRNKRPRYLEEFEAETWARDKMREAGIPVPRKEIVRAKEHVAQHLKQVKRKKGRRLDPKMLAFARS
jgi:hypothetical protein